MRRGPNANNQRNIEIVYWYSKGLTFGQISIKMGIARNVIAGVVRRYNAS